MSRVDDPNRRKAIFSELTEGRWLEMLHNEDVDAVRARMRAFVDDSVGG